MADQETKVDHEDLDHWLDETASSSADEGGNTSSNTITGGETSQQPPTPNRTLRSSGPRYRSTRRHTCGGVAPDDDDDSTGGWNVHDVGQIGDTERGPRRQVSRTAVTKHRALNAVGNLGVIETGLEGLGGGRGTALTSRPHSQLSSGEDGSYAAAGGDVDDPDRTTSNKTAVTGMSSRPGRCVVRRCAVRRNMRRFHDGKLKPRKILLHPMKIDLPERSMTAIIGPGGCGKTTLLKFLSGSLETSISASGGVNLPGTKSYMRAETNLHSFYTPRTYLRHYDRLTTGMRRGGKSREEIDGILRSLGLEDRKDTVVGDLFRRGLSNGERRRLDLALMILGAPDTLFCEEPSQNLDSETTFNVMQFLKGYCSQPGRRVIVTINKPSSVVWNMIDNVILLGQGRVIYEGPRFDMESFFAFNKFPTPKRFAPVDHYLSLVSGVGKKTSMHRNNKTLDDWAASFRTWQHEAEADEGDALADDIEMCFPTMVTTVNINRGFKSKSKCQRGFWIMVELTKRYLLDLFLNPGVLWLRFVMYSVLALFIGLLFLGLGDRTSTTSIWSRASVLFYGLSFFIFMVVAVVPFRCHDKAVVFKEIFNGYYHPVAHHVASTFASLFGVVLLAFITTVIMVPMAKFTSPFKFFLDMLLSLNCAEALAQMVAKIVSNYIVGIVALAGLFGFFMLLMGFMLVPSEFPTWLRWAYYLSPHTYAWRSLMYLEFSGPENVFDSIEFPTGMDVLRAYEIEGVNYSMDMVALFCYSIVIHVFSVVIILVKHKFYTRKLDDLGD